MKIGITAKLFVAILATNLLTAIAVGVAVRTSFSSGFRNYIQDREARRIDNLDRALVSAYQTNGSWTFLRGEESLWAAMNRPDHDLIGPRMPTDGGPSARDRPRDDPRSRSEGDAGSSPRRDDDADARRAQDRPPSDDHRGFDRPHGAEGRGDPPGPPPGLLVDLARKPVAGHLDSRSPSIERPVVVDGKTVGYLSTSAAPALLDTLDMRFRDEQLRAVWLIGIAAMLVATGVALVLARRFLAPIKRLGTATHQLASGDYTTRVAPASSDELGALLDDFNQLAQALEHNEQLRRNFMADISHELRTPLAVLRGELEALQDGVRPATRESIASLQAEVATLSKLVDDLYELALADVGALAYRFVRTDIAALLDAAMAAFAHRFSERKLGVEYASAAVPVMLDADPQRLTQLFNNLLENSVRHTNPGGCVRVTLVRDDQQIRIDLLDSAPGVPEAALERIFERLFRVEASRSREHGGAGLGLAICRNIVDAHRGDIHASPSALGGLWIHIRLPVARFE